LDEKFYIEINCQQKNHSDERVCGDVFLSKKIKEEGRIIIVLSDGLGHGIKANLLAILTSTLAASFTEERQSINRITDIITNTLPVDEVKQLNYSTFTIIEIDGEGEIKILEFENPGTLIFRGGRLYEPIWNGIVIESAKNNGREVLSTSFIPQKEDRIVFCTDGVVQSGLGSELYPTGWGQDNFKDFVLESISEEHDISAVKLAGRVINKANLNDQFFPKDEVLKELHAESYIGVTLWGHTGQPIGKIEKDTDRDYFMTAEEAKKYGLVDEVLTQKGVTPTLKK